MEWESRLEDSTIVSPAQVRTGIDWSRCRVERNLAGVECLERDSRLRRRNAGSKCRCIRARNFRSVVDVRAYDSTARDRYEPFHGEQCQFAYRTSLFNTTARDRYIVLQVGYCLNNSGVPAVRYPDVQREFEKSVSPADSDGCARRGTAHSREKSDVAGRGRSGLPQCRIIFQEPDHDAGGIL